MYTKKHENKQAAENHLLNIKKRGGYGIIEDGKNEFTVSYFFMDKSSKEEIDNNMLQLFFKRYKQIGGEHSQKEYTPNYKKFVEITQDAYISGMGSKNAAYKEWGKFIGSSKEANLYFRSVDEITPYS